MVLIVCPIARITSSVPSTASGIETKTITVERHEPRKMRIISEVSRVAINASSTSDSMA